MLKFKDWEAVQILYMLPCVSSSLSACIQQLLMT